MGVAACRKGNHQTQSSSSPDRTRRRARRSRERSPPAFQTSMASASSSSTSSRPLTSVLPKVLARVEAWWDSSEQVPALAGFCSPLTPADGEKRCFDSRRLHLQPPVFAGGFRCGPQTLSGVWGPTRLQLQHFAAQRLPRGRIVQAHNVPRRSVRPAANPDSFRAARRGEEGLDAKRTTTKRLCFS
jgi:hypothetical protein